jgi:hypothetical protein
MVRGSRTLLLGLFVLPPLAGCIVSYQGDVAARNAVAGAMIVGIVAAGEDRYYRVGPDGMRTPVRPAPPLDPTRRINVQDCTEPVDWSSGNLVCK